MCFLSRFAKCFNCRFLQLMNWCLRTMSFRQKMIGCLMSCCYGELVGEGSKADHSFDGGSRFQPGVLLKIAIAGTLPPTVKGNTRAVV
jgi:hypothetical protein